MSAPKAEPTATSPVVDEKHKTTTRRGSSHSHRSSPVPEAATVLGAGGSVGEPLVKAQSAASAFKNHQSPTRTSTQEKDKVQHAVEENGSAGIGEHIIKIKGENGVVSREEGDDEVDVVYPGGLQLGLLTFGLCIATFTVALGEFFLSTLYR